MQGLIEPKNMCQEPAPANLQQSSVADTPKPSIVPHLPGTSVRKRAHAWQVNPTRYLTLLILPMLVCRIAPMAQSVGCGISYSLRLLHAEKLGLWTKIIRKPGATEPHAVYKPCQLLRPSPTHVPEGPKPCSSVQMEGPPKKTPEWGKNEDGRPYRLVQIKGVQHGCLLHRSLR